MFVRQPVCVPFLASLLAGLDLSAASLFPQETAFRATYDASRVAMRGRVVDSGGVPVAGCTVRMDSGETQVSGTDGTFAFPGLSRSNQLLTVTATGYYRHILPVQLHVPLATTNVTLQPVVLWPETPSVVRFLFGGDTAFARRMLDPLERAARNEMPVENPDALISVSNSLPGTLDVVCFVKPLFLAADYPVVNFESVTTLDPSTPHWQKEFVYFTLPSSLPALKSLNIDYVGLGNNHTYDYLESGVSNTCHYLSSAGFHFSGLGSNSAAAYEPYRTTIKGTPYSLLAMTSIGGEQWDTNYVASTNKGGAAYIESRAEAQQAIGIEKAAGQVTILQSHVGVEYTFQPSSFALGLMKFGVDSGADLVVSHHTHVAQGVSMYRGVLLIHCLGNLCFDQDRLETMFGLAATVDMDRRKLRRAWGTPVYLEDYRPRLVSGAVNAVLCRRLSEFSQQLRAFPYNGQMWIATEPAQYSFADRRIVVPILLGSNGWSVIDLKDLAGPEESLARVETDTPGLIVRPGRDLMNFGDFEDIDVDRERGEASRWDFGSASTLALQHPYRGTAALCLQRSSSNLSDAVAAFRNRVRVMGDAENTPNKALSLVGYLRAQGSGPISIISRYYSSEGSAEFGEEIALDSPGGTFGWQRFAEDLHMTSDDPSRPGDPPTVNPRAIRVFVHHSPPATGVGYAWLDELAIVNWEEVLDPLTGPVLNTPHARDFLRVEATPGNYELALTFRKYRPAETDAGHGPDLAIETEEPDQSADRLWFRPTCVGFEDGLGLLLRNRGDQSLVVSNVLLAGGSSVDFSTRWLTADGYSTTSSVSVPPKGRTRVEVRFTPSAAGHREALLQLHTNDPDEAQSNVQIVLHGDAYANTPVRFISSNRSLSPTIRLQVPFTLPPANLVQEQLPPGLTPAHISAGGKWDTDSRTVQWRDVIPGSSLDYSVTGPPNAYSILGWVAAAGQVDVAVGHKTVILLALEDMDQDGLPDWWEMKFFDHRTGALAERDSDGDGQSNLAEFMAKTHPLDSGFQTQQLTPYLRQIEAGDGVARLKVIGFDGATYTIEESTNLQDWHRIFARLNSGETTAIGRTTTGTAHSRFFRALVE